MTEPKETRGGSRPGSGRKMVLEANKSKSRTISLTDIEWARFRLLGGTKWLRSMLKSFQK